MQIAVTVPTGGGGLEIRTAVERPVNCVSLTALKVTVVDSTPEVPCQTPLIKEISSGASGWEERVEKARMRKQLVQKVLREGTVREMIPPI